LKKSLLLFLLALSAAPAVAQIRPQPGPGDPHIRTVDFTPDQVVLLEGAPGYQITVELSPDEQVESVAVGDSGAWSVTANRAGDHLFVKALAGDVSTNMTVITSARLYNFELAPAASSADMAYAVRFRYPAAPPGPLQAVASGGGEGRYRLRGDKEVQPSEISDDGSQTFIRWPRDRSLPAVYALGDTGQEMLVNGMMREDDVFVISSVWRKLVFRMDKHVARATRQSSGS
jgi:type IV secretion system protein VirB9